MPHASREIFSNFPVRQQSHHFSSSLITLNIIHRIQTGMPRQYNIGVFSRLFLINFSCRVHRILMFTPYTVSSDDQ